MSRSSVGMSNSARKSVRFDFNGVLRLQRLPRLAVANRDQRVRRVQVRGGGTERAPVHGRV